MIQFCCCSLKPHSYFLLINYISMASISAIMQNVGYELYASQLHPPAIQFLLALFMLASIVVGLMAFAGLMVYIFQDSWNNTYQKFYVKSVIFWLFFGFAIIGLMLVSLIATMTDGSQIGIFIARWLVAGIFMGLLLKWNLNVQKVIDESTSMIDEEEKQGLNRPVVPN